MRGGPNPRLRMVVRQLQRLYQQTPGDAAIQSALVALSQDPDMPMSARSDVVVGPTGQLCPTCGAPIMGPQPGQGGGAKLPKG